MRTIAAGQALLAPSVTRRVVEEYIRSPAPGTPLPDAVVALTERENAVLKAIAMGLSNAEIGRQLFLAEATVKTHVTHMLAKLGLRDRLQAVVYAYESVLIRPRTARREMLTTLLRPPDLAWASGMNGPDLGDDLVQKPGSATLAIRGRRC